MKESQSRVKKRSEERDDLETIKAAAWAVFQHNNGGGSNSNRHPGYVLVQRATRFKLEAQMQAERERCYLAKEAVPSWDAGSTLFDNYELRSVFRHLDIAFQSADTQGSEHYGDRDETSNGAVADQRSPSQRNWLETVDKSQRFRGSYLESVDESAPITDGWKHDEPNLKANLVTNVEAPSAEICKDVQEVVSFGKVFQTVQFLRTANRWNVLNGRRCSFDANVDEGQKESSKQSRKSKLLAIFRSKGSPPKPSRQARIVPDDTSQKKPKFKTLDPHRKSGELVVADPVDSETSDSDDDEEEYYPRKSGAHKSGLHMVISPTFSRAVRLSSDMSNPNPEQGLRNHLRHGHLTYGHAHVAAGTHSPPSAPRKTSYSLNVTSPVQSPRRTMLDGSREDFDLRNHHHHHHHHIAQQGDDYELTVPDIVRRVSRKSFEEVAHRLSIEESTGIKAPRNSLDSTPFISTTPAPGSKLFV